jgi:uncharacterized protein YjaG (DUF416 family)
VANFSDFESAARFQALSECLAIDELHHHVMRAALLADVIDIDQVAVRNAPAHAHCTRPSTAFTSLAQATERKRFPISVVSNDSIVRFIVSVIAGAARLASAIS